jgi:hypothetical protein
MTRIKHTTRQAILDNNALNVRSNLAKAIRTQTTTEIKENKSIRKIKSLLKKTRRKTRRFKSKSMKHRMCLIIFLLINDAAVALREIRRYQKSQNLLMLKVSMRRLMKKLAFECNNQIRFQAIATKALQEATKTMLVN